jgi:predicted CXXCH cytochrome family protein
MRRLAWLLAMAVLVGAPSAFGGIATTKHNLSVSGPGTIRAATETQICIFCHTPHNANPSGQLWNRADRGTVYTPYTSTTAAAKPGQPTRGSLLCLSCHDGLNALGDVLKGGPIAMAGGVTTVPAGSSRLGTDLRDDHPVSFSYASARVGPRANELVDPATLTGRVRLDHSGDMQCAACHDPHNDSFGKFLVMDNAASALCQTCHTKNFWANSTHRTSTRSWNGTAPDPWPHTEFTTVATNACENCHQPHAAGGPQRLLNAPREEDNCIPCHNANVAVKNIQTEFNKVSRHPVDATTGVHDAAEPAVVQARHVECVDCHNPHATKTVAGTIAGPLTGVRGITISGAETNPSTLEYQICLRCHGDSTNAPAPRAARQIAQTNVRLKFDTSNPSQHAVAGPGRSAYVPSLISPLTNTSINKCTSCHNNNAGPGAAGTGPNGPHGSTFPTLLERRYETLDNTSESAAAYALCYKCHDRNSILSNTSFPEHSRHVQNVRAPCNVCHDPHGISVTQGTILNNSRLINFNTAVVSPAGAQLRWEQTRVGTPTLRAQGRCFLVCHGKSHNPISY